MTETEWDIEPGTTLVRRALHERWGGSRFGGIEPSVKAASVFLFSKPSAGEAFGYKFDGRHRDGTYHYTGDGQEGDQSPDLGGNRAVLAADDLGRTLRLFRSEGTNTKYVGAFALADPSKPYYLADAPDRNGEIRSVLVFRLIPLGEVAQDLISDATPDVSGPVEMPLESSDVEAYVASRPDEPKVAVRREAQMVARYERWLADRGNATVRHRIPLPDGGSMFTDVFNKGTSELVEAKASGARVYVRAGLGQVLDYARYLDHKTKALLLASRPSDDLIELLHTCGVNVIWETVDGFERADA